KLELKSLKLSKTKIKVNSLMDDCMDLLKPLIVEKQIELKLEVGLHEFINADRGRIEQVIVNLIKNSIDFVPQDDGKITIRVEKYGSSLLFTVEDNGPGIKSEDLEKIFDKFFKSGIKSDRKYGGSGLGLAICKSIVEEHGGKIWVDSKHHPGCLFKFTIPIMQS
ncbi:MAG: HAMP domain-containing histidine kinase, partial [Thaumarchaeota archaeon]|nr:HAMP domain-containing histidine kinase [Nitrososphaerota archaeon]